MKIAKNPKNQKNQQTKLAIQPKNRLKNHPSASRDSLW